MSWPCIHISGTSLRWRRGIDRLQRQFVGRARHVGKGLNEPEITIRDIVASDQNP